MRRWFCLPFFLVASLSALAGCTVVKAGEGGVRRTLIGVVRVDLPPTTGHLTAIDAQTIGFGWDGGPFLGFRGSNWIAAAPEACQLTIIIRSAAQASHAARVLELLKGEQICTADFTDASPPLSR